MAANVPPPGAPRPNNNNLVPPPNYNPSAQRPPDYLADNLQNLNLNRPPSMPNSAPRPSPYGQPPPFPSSAPPSGVPGASPPFSRPGPSLGVLARPSMPTSGPSQATLPPGGAPLRPTGPPVGQPSPFVSRPPPGSLPSPMVGYVTPGSGPPSSGPFHSSSLLSGQVAQPPPQPGARPISLSSPMTTTGQFVPPSSGPGGLMSNGPPHFTSGAIPGAPRFPPTGNVQQPPLGPPQAVMSAMAPTRAPTMRSHLGGSVVSAPPGPPTQPASPFSGAPSPFSAAPQGMPLPPGSPYGSPSWPLQPGQVNEVSTSFAWIFTIVYYCSIDVLFDIILLR